jgi:DNA-binding response OmpR family regulator
MPVLVVEDQAILAMSYEDALTGAGYTVVGPVASAKRALQIAAETPPAVAVVDIELRDKTNGMELAKILKDRWGTGVLFVSGYHRTITEEDLIAQHEFSGIGFLAKPFGDEELLAAVQVVRLIKEGKKPAPENIPESLHLFFTSPKATDAQKT